MDRSMDKIIQTFGIGEEPASDAAIRAAREGR